jgi:peptide/nickel transport system permease protein
VTRLGPYIVRRLLGGAVTLLGVSVLAFLTTALIPGNPADVILGSYATPQRVRAVTASLGLNQPLPVRYGKWLWALLHGNLGASVFTQQKVAVLLGQALPVTLELTILAIMLTVVVGVPLSLLLAKGSHTWWVRVLSGVMTLGVSVPGFVIGVLLIIAFAVEWHLLPSGGYVSFAQSPAQNLKDMVLPTVTLAAYIGPALTRFMRARAVDVMHEEFIEVARAKGISQVRLFLRHIAPSTALQSLTYFGLQVGTLVSGAIVTEVIFSLPGMGQTGLNALLDRDYPVVQGVVLVVGTGYVLINLAVDLLYGVVDPRVRHG